MTIHNHPTLSYTQRYPFPASHPCQVVTCDFCARQAKGVGNDAGYAAEKARKEGFVTVMGERASDPKFWACSVCATDPNKIIPARADDDGGGEEKF